MSVKTCVKLKLLIYIISNELFIYFCLAADRKWLESLDVFDGSLYQPIPTFDNLKIDTQNCNLDQGNKIDRDQELEEHVDQVEKVGGPDEDQASGLRNQGEMLVVNDNQGDKSVSDMGISQDLLTQYIQQDLADRHPDENESLIQDRGLNQEPNYNEIQADIQIPGGADEENLTAHQSVCIHFCLYSNTLGCAKM